MVFLGFSPYFVFSSFFITLLLDRGAFVTGNKELPTASPWYPSGPSAIASKGDPDALKKVLPLVTFDCRGKTGYFPDSKFNCEVFHYCQPDGARNTFHCPAHQLFNQLSMVCEEKTVHNSRLCKEGSINPSKLQRFSSSKKLGDPQQTSPILKPSSNSSSSTKESPTTMMTLEDLLSYMNSGHAGKEANPTFISRFQKAEEIGPTKHVSESAISTPVSEAKSAKKESSTMSSDSRLMAEGSEESFRIARVSAKPGTNSKKKSEDDEDTSTEYDAIEGRKFRKHKRVGRIIDIQGDQKTKDDNKPHTQLSSRSATDSPLAEDATLPPADDEEARNGSSHSLFSTDRNRAKDFRKRKRFPGRKRKVLTPGLANDTDTGSEFVVPTTTASFQASRQDLDALRSNAYRRRKSQRTRTRDDVLKSLQNSPKTEKVEPYSLPPLPTPGDDQMEVTTESMHREEKKRDPLKEGRSKNPWHKPTQAPAEDGGHLKFGEKVPDLDQHYYQTDAKMMEGPAAPDYYGSKDLPSTSEELLGEEYKEKVLLHSKNPGDERPSPKSKLKILKTFSQEDAIKYESHPEKHHHSPSSPNFFPPPRAEAREHHSTPPQQMIHESSAEKHKTEHSSPKATTEDPFRVTHPYLGKYQTGVQQLKDLEEERWKINSEKAKANEKVAVGSTFFFQNIPNSESFEPPKKLRLQSPPPTETPVLNVHKEKDMSKHTEAHQHLSKIMNDFFAMSSSNTPGHSHVNLNKEDDIIIPEYRIPDEDIYAGSESVNEDVEEIPPELLEVVDLLTGHVNNEERDMKPQASHEIIRINGPITDSHLEKIFLDDKFDEEFDQRSSAEGSYKKFVVVPQPDDREEDMKEMEDEAEYTSLNLEPFLKQISNDKSVTVIPLKTESILQRQPTLLSAKKIPVRVIYRDQVTDTEQPKLSNRKPNIKYVQSHLPLSRLQQNSLGRRPASRPTTHMYSTHSRPSIVFHPSTLFPPHPPPLQKKQLPFRVGYPFVSNTRSFVQNSRHVPRRRKRSIINRLRRQIRQNQHFLPFSSPVFSAFNPKFVPTFSPFKNLFGPASLHTSGSHLTPFTYPSFSLAKPSQNRPNIFQPSHPRPPPVRHVTQSGHQTVIVEEVPVPIHVEVPSPNLIHPASPGAQSAKLHPRYPVNQLRTPSPPALQTPPLIQRPQHRFPPPPNNYRPLGMPSNARPPAINFQPGNPFSQHLPPSITSQGQLYALGVTNKPLLPPNPRPPRPPGLNSPRNPPRPYNPFDIQANGYPNFPYFQGAFTTPISNEPVAGRLMYSGYKPPKSTLGTKPPKPSHQSMKERKPSESKANRSRSKPTQDYFEAPARPMRESHVSYTEEVINRGNSRPKPNYTADYSAGHADMTSPRQSLSKGPTSDEMVPRKRKPGRRRRPRPHSTTTQTTSILNDISPTPPPPEQIPPPPADYTSKPHHDVINSLPSFNEGTKTHEASNNFPPAGYYGKDQLVQFFDSSSKAYQKSTSPKPYHKDLGESTSSAELDESIMSMSGEDRNEPAFGTRLRSKPQGQPRNRQSKNRQPVRSQTQNTEVRTRPSSRPDVIVEQKKREFTQTRPNEGSKMQIRNENTPPRRRRPSPPRPRSRPPPMHTTPTQPKMHNFNYNENMANFYSVPRGLQNLVAPVDHPQKNFGGSRDMFGLPHPVIDQNIYSLRPQGAPVDFNPNFFSVPAHVSQQQQSPLHKMNIKPIPESERDFFTAPDAGATTITEASTPERQETEQKVSPHKSGGESNEQRDTPVKRLRKPKRKNRYNPHSNEQKDSAEVNSAKPYTEQTTARESIAIRYKEKPTTIAITTPEPRSTSTLTFHSQNDIKESPVVYKQRNPLLPKAVPDLSKSLLNGKLDIQKLNATISTSVSVSGAAPQTSNMSSEEKENKRVFSSQNGGLAVVRKGPKRKRARQRVSTTTGVPYVNNNDASTDAKYEIAASVLDIIKATTETERQTSGYYEPTKNEKPSSSRVSNTWVEKPSNKRQS